MRAIIVNLHHHSEINEKYLHYLVKKSQVIRCLDVQIHAELSKQNTYQNIYIVGTYTHTVKVSKINSKSNVKYSNNFLFSNPVMTAKLF